MDERTHSIRITSKSLLRNLLGITLALFLLCANTRAQGSAQTITPPTLTPGSPAGSYPLSDFDTVNLFNGNINFRLPLMKIGGRGESQIPLLLDIQTRWRVEPVVQCSPCGPIYYPTYNWWIPYPPGGYRPGLMSRRLATWGEQEDSTGFVYPLASLLRLTFTAADGTEYELRDTVSGGEPKQVYVPYYPPGATFFLRGSVFVTPDGTSATFLSCTANGTLIPVYDNSFEGDRPDIEGYLLLRDGTRYRIDGGLVSWLQDRNGNRINFYYESVNAFGDPDGRVTRIVDSLNRQVSITYDTNDGAPYGVCDRITFQGFQAATRYIRISKDTLSNALAPGFTLRTPQSLFPDLSGSAYTTFNPQVTTAVWLPDGRSYTFKYNDYGELARVVLPTGGAFEYDWDVGMHNSGTGGVIGVGDIYRRIVEKRIYKDGGSVYESRITYSRPETFIQFNPPSNVGYVDMVQYGASPNHLILGRHYFYGSAWDNPNAIANIDYTPWNYGKEYKTEALDADGIAILQRIENTFDQTAPSWWNPQALGCSSCIAPSNNPRITQTLTTWAQTNQVAKQSYSYDQYNNKTVIQEFDYGTSGPTTNPLRRTEIDYVATNEVNDIDYTGTNISSNLSLPHLRSLPKEQRVFSVSSTGTQTLQAKTHFYYDQYSQSPLVNRPGIVGMDPAYATTTYVTRGNLTSTSRWLDTTGGWITTTQEYDIAGHVVETADPLGNTSQTDFAASLNSYAFPTTLRTPVPDPSGQRGSSARLQTFVDYDFNSGLVKSITDPNGQTTYAYYNDALDRLTSVVRPSGGGQTSFFYGDTVGNLHLHTQTAQNASQTLDKFQYFDGLGRAVKSSLSEGATSILAETQYDALGRLSQVSNPYRAGDTVYWTMTEYDALSRISQVTEPGGAITSSSYSGNGITVTDPASKSRKSVSDALGRLIQLIEDPGSTPHLNHQTNYTYDALDNLRKVAQGSQQTRYFMYDSLKRLLRTRSPEHDVNTFLPPLTDPVTSNSQWSCGYSYDNNGNLQSKTDPRNITCNYTYDAMNRATTRSYANDPAQTPPVGYKYDGAGATAQNALGRMTSVSTSGSFVSSYTYDNFDSMGEVLHSTQTTDGQAYQFSYGYNLAGAMTTKVYPSGRTITNDYDAAGRLTTVNGQKTGEPNKVYASTITYAAHGAMASMIVGPSANNLVETTTFNNRLQPTFIKLGTPGNPASVVQLGYMYGVLVGGSLDTTKNNGNVQSQTVTVGASAIKQSYLYDVLNRLQSAAEDSNQTAKWTQSYAFDLYGNRTSLSNTGVDGALLPTTSTPSLDPGTNRINQLGFVYDAAGNLKQEPGKSYDYDAENRQTRFNNGAVIFSYDGDGRRVKKIVTGNPTVTTVFVYNLTGQLIAEYTDPSPSTSGGTSYLTTDHLGSTRVVTNSSGGVVGRHDYLPYGEEIPSQVGGRSGIGNYAAADGVRQKFAQKERDNESGLDYFLARYYSSAQGRFTSVDNPRYAKATDPQTWNLYAYVRNGPLNKIDPDGRNWFRIGDHYEWHEGNTYTYEDQKHKHHTVRSNFTHLLVFERTGTNAQGAITGTLKLYEQNKVIATANAFSGGNRNVDIPPGNFMIRLDIRGKADSADDLKPVNPRRPNDRELKQFYGIQEIAPVIHDEQGRALNGRWEWGSIRASLNEEPGENRQEYRGNYLHGKQRAGDYTHGCICNRDEHILNILLGLDYKQVPKVPVVVR